MSLLCNALVCLILTTGPTPTPAAAQDLDWLRSFEAQRLVEAWTFRGVVDDDIPTLAAGQTTAVRVTLRDNGYAIAEGDAFATEQDLLGDEETVNLGQLLARATQTALGHANARRAHQRANQDNPQRPNENEDDGFFGLEVDLQIAGPLTPLTIRGTRPGPSLMEQWVPGYHGLVLRDPLTGAQALLWPGTALAQAISVEGQIGRALRDVGRGAGRYDPSQLIGLEVNRFAITHVVGLRDGAGRAELERGHATIPLGSISEQTVAGLRARLRQHLATRYKEPSLMPGDTYLPMANRFDGEANERDAALGALALIRAELALGQEFGGQSPAMVNAMTFARRRLQAQLDNEPLAFDEEASALYLLALIESESRELTLETRDSAIQRLDTTLDRLTQEQAGREELVVLVTLHRAAARTQRPELANRVSALAGPAIERVLAKPGLSRLAWSAELLAAINDPGELMRLRNRLDALMDDLERLQRVDPPMIGPDDVIGSLRLERGPRVFSELPDWTTAYGLRFVATMALAGQQPDDRIDRQVFASLAARYLALLNMSEAGAFASPYTQGAVGGIRQTFLDPRMPLAASGETLLAAVRYEQWLSALRAAKEDDNTQQ
ncbi:MAG: hypothetical protein RLN76_09150 [Phycisphaeraceae bacterium]